MQNRRGLIFTNRELTEMIIINILARCLTVLSCITIAIFFIFAFIEQKNGSFFIIYASLAFIFLCFLFLIIYFIHPPKKEQVAMQNNTQQFILLTFRYILLPLSTIAIFGSIIFFFITGDNFYLLNMGCYIAFIMIVVLSEVVFKILFPLAGIK
jgi:hypothetical protein